MSLHTDWTDAKKDSKTKFKAAHKAKRDALEKQIKAGDTKARAKVLDENLMDLGMGKGDDLDKYFSFKEAFGPTLDEFEKLHAAGAAARRAAAGTMDIDDVIANPKLLKAFAPFAKRSGLEDFLLFVVNEGYKADPVKAYALFIKRGAKLEINVDDGFTAPLRALEGNDAQMKAQGPALLKACRDELVNITGQDTMAKFKRSDEFKAAVGTPPDLTPLKKKLTDTLDSYREQIRKYDAKWKNIQPDFRKPLLDAMDRIETALNAP
jgi:hypothetical protein